MGVREFPPCVPRDDYEDNGGIKLCFWEATGNPSPGGLLLHTPVVTSLCYPTTVGLAWESQGTRPDPRRTDLDGKLLLCKGLVELR